MAEPTPDWVTSKGGVFHSRYDWPMINEDLATERLWETPEGMLRHEWMGKGFVIIYALPLQGPGVIGKVPMCEHVTYDTESAV